MEWSRIKADLFRQQKQENEKRARLLVDFASLCDTFYGEMNTFVHEAVAEGLGGFDAGCGTHSSEMRLAEYTLCHRPYRFVALMEAHGVLEDVERNPRAESYPSVARILIYPGTGGFDSIPCLAVHFALGQDNPRADIYAFRGNKAELQVPGRQGSTSQIGATVAHEVLQLLFDMPQVWVDRPKYCTLKSNEHIRGMLGFDTKHSGSLADIED
jgi:hypothetical protein